MKLKNLNFLSFAENFLKIAKGYDNMTNTNGLTFREFKGFDEMLIKANTTQLDYLLGALVDEIRARTT